MLRKTLLAIVATVIVTEPVRIAHAISWDDAGNSASKLWDDNGNWNPDGDPDSLDVFIGNLLNAFGDTTLVDRAYSIDSLTITNGADVINSTDNGSTNDWQLLVNGDTTISDSGSSIIIYGGDSDGLDTDNLTINDGARLILNSSSNSGTAVVEVDGDSGLGLLDLNEGGTITGAGRIDLEGAGATSTTVLRNDGTIVANTAPTFIGFPPAAGTLQIRAAGTNAANALFDWDGTVPITAVLQANGNQTLDIDIDPGNDAWSGTMNLNTGSTIDIQHAWSMDSGTINANTGAFGLILPGQDPNPGPAAHIDGANWTMNGGTITLEDTWDSLQLDSQLVADGGTINNSGTMIFNGGASIFSGVDFNMLGSKASLVVNSAVNIDTPDFQLDAIGGAGTTTINVGGNLDLDLGAGADEDFDHVINMNGGELDVTTTDNDWSLTSSGTINAAGGVTSTINGETFNINGDIDVSASSTLRINAVSSFGSSSNVTIGAGSVLNMGTVTYNGGSYTGAGSFRKGGATIASDTTWSVDNVVMDDGFTTVQNGARLTVNTNEFSVGDGIDSTITVEDTGELILNRNGGGDVVFDSAGRLVYNGNNISSTFLPAPVDGSALVFTGTSQLNINGDGTSNTRIELNGGTLNINDAGEDFRMNGGDLLVGTTNEISGGTINGPGELQIASARALRGNGTINAQVDGDGTSQLIATGGTLNVNGGIQDIGTIGTAGAGSILNVTDPWNTNVTNEVVLDRGTIQGATITNDGANGITGKGILASRVNNNTRINASGGLLTVQTAGNNNDWDGSGNAGTLRANSGTLELHDNSTFLFNGTVEATSGTVRAVGFELEFDPASTLRLAKGLYSATSPTDFGGTIEVVAGATSVIQVAGASSTFENTSTTTLNDVLRLEDGLSVVEAGATFGGGSKLVNTTSHELVPEDGSSINVLVENQGLLTVGFGASQSTLLDFEQTATGILDVEIGGTGLSDYDRLSATGLMQLDGELDVNLTGGFNPALNDTFTILSAAAGINGVFSSLDFSGASLDPTLVWDVIYNPTNVQLAVIDAPVALPGDYDGDGFVGQGDLDLVLLNWGAQVPPDPVPAGWVNDLPSGLIGQGNLDGVLLNWGNGVPPIAAISAVPEPSTLFLATLALGCSLLTSRRKP